MKVSFSPQRRDDNLVVEINAEIVKINGKAFDLSVIPNGATLPASATGSEYFIDEISRVNNVLVFTLLLPHGANPPRAIAWPEAVKKTPDGVLIDTSKKIYPWPVEWPVDHADIPSTQSED